ncbi:MAG: hypothetical protein V2I97_15835 [Desulfococcaceae bacterium]|jgi:hypothetical protein|nr:hypothetical protein [Desulfococcaceae bacterium]
MRIPLVLTDHAFSSQTFSFLVYAQYRTRSGDTEQTDVKSFSIRLYSEEDFDEIDNPYAEYAEGGPVSDPEMFYGREELIQNIGHSIKESRLQSKCIIVFGQKRAGKSSILYHLKLLLNKEKKLIILDIGNIGAFLDEHSAIPLLYQILWSILRELKDETEDRVSDGFTPLNIPFPGDIDFFSHPSPMVLFNNIFDDYKKAVKRLEDWKNTRIVVLIDEFSYIHNFILSGKLPESFMKNWKALLQKNYFSAVLAGQDAMPKFKQRFPNEFGTTQDERVTYLRREDAEKLIDEPVRIGGREGKSRYRERAIERVVNLSAGSPFYIQIICNRLVEYMNRKRASLVTQADIEQVKNDLIRGVNALGLDKFDNLINSGDTSEDAISDEDALKVLKSIAMNSHTGPCSRNSIICPTCQTTDLILDDLVKREVLEREREHYYRIRVGLFKEWLSANM